MAKARRVYLCRSCGNVQAKWMGKCPDCSAWDSLEETTLDPAGDADPQKRLVAAWGELAQGAAMDAAGGVGGDGPGHADGGGFGLATSVAVRLRDVDESHEPMRRLASGIGELDRVLGGGPGGGLVPGSAVLIGGEPGIGKSTLMLQAARAWASDRRSVLYVSSEESVQQVGARAKRLECAPPAAKPPPTTAPTTADRSRAAGGPADGRSADLFLLADTNLARIVEQARRVKPAVLIIDSVQMIYKSDVPAAPGSITQLRRCTAELVYLAKASGIAVVLVGHVTKEGTLAGPRLLEHLVDCVLTFEGDRYHAHRVVRAVKNRFGTTLEIGIFEMTGTGLREVPEGAGVSAALVAEPRPGSAVCPVMTGTRCVLVEMQALTATGFLGAAKRKSSGLDANRLAMLIAVLEQHAGLRLADRDVFASSVGGLRVTEPASDLALLLAIAGAHYRKALAPATAVVGEVGLGGEVRAVPHVEQRVREVARLGYTRLIVAAANARELNALAPKRGGAWPQIVPVKNVDQAIEQF